jgi:molybdopterin molybdotransferase
MLAMRQAMWTDGTPMMMKAGVATGPVVRTPMGGVYQVHNDVMGMTVTAAARIEQHCRDGDIVLDAGLVISAPVAGYLASIGVCEVPVHARPRVGIVPTGTELVPLGSSLGPGQIYDSNSVALAAAQQTDGIAARVYPPLRDDAGLQRAAITKVMAENDIVMITGGVSVGHHDHVKDILAALEVTPLFWKVRQKPGKPLFAGVRGPQVIFGLPGNPASSLMAYYEYIRPAVRKKMGHAEWMLREMILPCTSAITKEAGKTHFLRARIISDNGEWRVAPCCGQGSHSLKSFAEATALIVLPEEVTHVQKGQEVTVHVLP